MFSLDSEAGSSWCKELLAAVFSETRLTLLDGWRPALGCLGSPTWR